jgi:hypothetical protein
MNGLPKDRFSSDRRQADSSIRSMLDLIMANIEHLRKVYRGGRMERAATSMLYLVRQGEELTPGQRRYVEGIWESVMQSAGFESVPLHVDKKRKSVRFG